MQTNYSFQRSSVSSSSSSVTLNVPERIPDTVYRVQLPNAQTKYSFSEGFRAKNQTTILSTPHLVDRFGMAHLRHQTNISSPFISVYTDLAHATHVAQRLSERYGTACKLVSIDTRHFARGPLFRAADVLKNASEDVKNAHPIPLEDDFMHQYEYLVQYRIPAQALINEEPVGQTMEPAWKAVGSSRRC